MQMLCKLFLIFAAALLANCRSRADSSRTSEAAPSASALKGRVAVFDIYNKTTQSTRQAPGIMVSSRGVVISGMHADETLSLADDQRKGEKYIPIPSTQNGTFFVGLSAEQAGLSLAPTTADATPPSSARTMNPLDAAPPELTNTEVIMYNEVGFVRALATTSNKGRIIKLHNISRPRRYPIEGELDPLYNGLFSPKIELDFDIGIKMLRKGGAIFVLDEKAREDAFIKYNNVVSLMKGPKLPDTIAISAFLIGDPGLTLGTFYPPSNLSSVNVLPNEIAAFVEAASVKFKVPRELKSEILPYFDCFQ